LASLGSRLAEQANVETIREKPALLTQGEGAAMLGVSPQTMRRLVEAGSLEQVRIVGLGRPRYRRADIEALVRDGRAP
jgi:excisionase family DNA binding protein